jgi:hypothetical protein
MTEKEDCPDPRWQPVYEEHPEHVTKEVLELKLNNLKSDLRLLILASVALNQILANASLPKAVTLPAITVAILAPLAKGVWAFLSR